MWSIKSERGDSSFRPHRYTRNKAAFHTHCKDLYLLTHTQKHTQDQYTSIPTLLSPTIHAQFCNFLQTSNTTHLRPSKSNVQSLSALQDITEASSPGNTVKTRFTPSTNHCLLTAMLRFVSRLTFGVLGAETDKSQKLAWMISVKQSTTLQTVTLGILVA